MEKYIHNNCTSIYGTAHNTQAQILTLIHKINKESTCMYIDFGLNQMSNEIEKKPRHHWPANKSHTKHRQKKPNYTIFINHVNG